MKCGWELRNLILSHEILKISSFITLFYMLQINRTIHPSVAKLFSQLYVIQIYTEFTIWRNHGDVVSTIGINMKCFCQMLENLQQNVVIKDICASLKIWGFDYVYKKIIISESLLQWLHQSSHMKKFVMQYNMDLHVNVTVTQWHDGIISTFIITQFTSVQFTLLTAPFWSEK
jgi:hypothetical protein